MHKTAAFYQIEDASDYDITMELARSRPVATDTAASLIFHHQGSHTIRIANKTYAFSNSDFAFLGKNNILNFFLYSLEHQRMLGKKKEQRLNSRLSVFQNNLIIHIV